MAEFGCDAYPPAQQAEGRRCYFADPGLRSCLSHTECAESAAAARRLLHNTIIRRAAAGDPAAARLAERYPDPASVPLWNGEAAR